VTQTNKFLFFEQGFPGGSAALLAVLAAPPHSLRKGSAFPYAVLRIMRLCRWGRASNYNGLRESQRLSARSAAKPRTHSSVWLRLIAALCLCGGLRVIRIGARIATNQTRIYEEHRRDAE